MTEQVLAEQDRALSLLVSRGVLDESRAYGVRSCEKLRVPSIVVCGSCFARMTFRARGCNSRLCSWCNQSRRARMYARLADTFRTCRELRFLTLSFKNTDRLERSHLLGLHKEFEYVRTILRRKGYTFGTYAAVLEVKHNGRDWHPHLHILYDGDYIPQRLVSDALLSATKGRSRYAYIERVRQERRGVRSSNGALRYVLKYLGKAEGVVTSELMAEYYVATEGVRLVNVGYSRRAPKVRRQKLCCPSCGATSGFLTIYNTEPEWWTGIVAVSNGVEVEHWHSPRDT